MLDESLTPKSLPSSRRPRPLPPSMSRPTPRAGNGSGTIRWRPSRLACAAGLNTIELAKQHGGQGLSFSCKLRAFEEIAKAGLRLRLRLINHHNACARFAATASRRMSRACCRAC
jgi:acrylyl-CoA reductase (NADPH)